MTRQGLKNESLKCLGERKINQSNNSYQSINAILIIIFKYRRLVDIFQRYTLSHENVRYDIVFRDTLVATQRGIPFVLRGKTISKSMAIILSNCTRKQTNGQVN